MENYSTIELELVGNTATVWLNRPENQNAVSIEMLNEITHCFNTLEINKDVRVIFLRGKGKSFCAGADLKRMMESHDLSFEENLNDGRKWVDCLNAISNSSKATIAIATGNIFGGGNGLLCAADIAIAESNSLFSFSEAKLGLAPSTILPYVLSRMNEHKAKYLMFTSKRINAHEAVDYNLVDFVVPSNELESFTESITDHILQSSPGAIKEIKFLIRELKRNLTADEIRELTAKSIATLKKSAEALEGLKSFAEKRPPVWTKKE